MKGLLAETQGSDVPMAVAQFRKKYRELDDIPVLARVACEEVRIGDLEDLDIAARANQGVLNSTVGKRSLWLRPGPSMILYWTRCRAAGR